MMWYLQLLVELVAQGLTNEAVLNTIFAALVLWGGFGKHPKQCALMTAALHVLLVVV